MELKQTHQRQRPIKRKLTIRRSSITTRMTWQNIDLQRISVLKNVTSLASSWKLKMFLREMNSKQLREMRCFRCSSQRTWPARKKIFVFPNWNLSSSWRKAERLREENENNSKAATLEREKNGCQLLMQIAGTHLNKLSDDCFARSPDVALLNFLATEDSVARDKLLVCTPANKRHYLLL